ncbi:hypothetical protein [Winogradskyella sp. SM1960]|uniref:hypothetical protein n=1 Tax=Winogradskyella sp. SM1960 TaxID=2865955 RepID=UPI001CD77F21|nr:hypothetical protein [Winogradskyella sp. SM1960]
MENKLANIKTDIEDYASDSKLTELEVLDKLKDYYFNKKVNENLKLYKKGKRKVSEITKDLKISPRKFYAILNKKKINYTKYNKNKDES